MNSKFNILWCECTILCLGARTSIKDKDGQTPLQAAKEKLSDESDPEARQRYQKVHEDTHTITQFAILRVTCWQESCTIVKYACQEETYFCNHGNFAVQLCRSNASNGTVFLPTSSKFCFLKVSSVHMYVCVSYCKLIQTMVAMHGSRIMYELFIVIIFISNHILYFLRIIYAKGGSTRG